jgi:hypothetical protein
MHRKKSTFPSFIRTVQYTTVQKLFEDSFRRFLSRSLQRIDFKNASKNNSPQTDCQRDGACKRYKLAKLSVGDRERIYEQHR